MATIISFYRLTIKNQSAKWRRSYNKTIDIFLNLYHEKPKRAKKLAKACMICFDIISLGFHGKEIGKTYTIDIKNCVQDYFHYKKIAYQDIEVDSIVLLISKRLPKNKNRSLYNRSAVIRSWINASK